MVLTSFASTPVAMVTPIAAAQFAGAVLRTGTSLLDCGFAGEATFAVGRDNEVWISCRR